MAAYDANWLHAFIIRNGTLCVFKAVGDSFSDEELLDFVSTGGFEFEYELTLSFDDFSIFSISHEFEMDS